MKHIVPISDFPQYLKNFNEPNLTSYRYFKKFIEIFKIQDRYFLVIIDKPLFFEISDEAYEFFTNLDAYDSFDVDNNKYLNVKNELDKYVHIGVFNEFSTINNTKQYIDNLCLLVSQTCNLSCKYCFAEEGKYGENVEKIMNFNTAKCAIDKYFEHNANNTSTINLEFFGGEPLVNKALIEQTIEYCELRRVNYKFKVRYGLITNGTLLDNDIQILLDKFNLQLRISLDGTKKSNDKYRIFSNKNISVYDTVINKINKLNIDKSKIEVVMTYVDPENCLVDSLKALVEEGFKFISILPLMQNLKTISGFDNQEKVYISLMKQLVDVIDYISELSYLGKIIHIDFLQKNLLQIYRPTPILKQDKLKCSAGTRNLILNTKGEIYPCDLFLFEDKYKLGNIADGIKSVDLFKRFNIEYLDKENHQICKSCYLRYMCKGRCPYKALNRNMEMENIEECEYTKYKLYLTLYFITNITRRFEYPYIKNWGFMGED